MIIKNVKFKNNKVEIVMDEGSFFISKENYIENPLTIDSNIDQKEINELLEKERVIEAKISVIKTLNKKVLTEYEVYKHLKDKEIDNKYIKEIISSLTNIGLINDDYACDILVDSFLVKKKGREEIYKRLVEKRIDENIIRRALENIDEELYVDNFNKVSEKYIKMYSNKSSRVKENMVKQKLKEYGYENKYIESLAVEINNDEDVTLARKYLAKLLKNKSIDMTNYENINKIKTKLVMKGFNYDIINLVLKEVIRDETY